jgi:hypothetical protein
MMADWGLFLNMLPTSRAPFFLEYALVKPVWDINNGQYYQCLDHPRLRQAHSTMSIQFFLYRKNCNSSDNFRNIFFMATFPRYSEVDSLSARRSL